MTALCVLNVLIAMYGKQQNTHIVRQYMLAFLPEHLGLKRCVYLTALRYCLSSEGQ